MNHWLPIIALLAHSVSSAGEFTRLKSDEQIIFYPSFAQRIAERNVWRAEVRGVVFEPEKARVSLAALHQTLELKTGELTPAESEIFKQRAQLFLVDHERGKKIFIRLGTNEFSVGKSAKDGTFTGAIEFGDEAWERRSPDRLDSTPHQHQAELGLGAPFATILSSGDTRNFSGTIFPLTEAGVSVISDIDDTIKITEVRDRQATLRNTFLREFRPVPGMAEFYQALARSNHAAFHYVSASPWQLYEPLSGLVRSNGFPAGTFHLKPFRWKDRSFFSLFGDPVKYKLSVIEPILKQFPNRKFILVGDSGERDPEIYGELARKFPKQIKCIYIRDVTGELYSSERYAQAFRTAPRSKWQIFVQPGEIRIASE
jgi:hypothetical protein